MAASQCQHGYLQHSCCSFSHALNLLCRPTSKRCCSLGAISGPPLRVLSCSEALVGGNKSTFQSCMESHFDRPLRWPFRSFLFVRNWPAKEAGQASWPCKRHSPSLPVTVVSHVCNVLHYAGKGLLEALSRRWCSRKV